MLLLRAESLRMRNRVHCSCHTTPVVEDKIRDISQGAFRGATPLLGIHSSSVVGYNCLSSKDPTDTLSLSYHSYIYNRARFKGRLATAPRFLFTKDMGSRSITQSLFHIANL